MPVTLWLRSRSLEYNLYRSVCEQKLVVETFEELWFAPVSVTCRDAVYVQRTSMIIDIMAQCRCTGYRSFERLLENVSRHLLCSELFVSAVIANVCHINTCHCTVHILCIFILIVVVWCMYVSWR